MELSEIRRISLTKSVMAPDAEAEPEILREAKEICGYEPRTTKNIEVQKETPLLDVLARLEIEPLNAEDVIRYMTETETAAHLESRLSGLTRSAGGSMNVGKYFGMWATGWDEQALNKYAEPIPEFVLNKAVLVKKALPSVELMIWVLREAKDPFLSAKFGDEQYFIEVWDEPRFEGRIAK